MYDNSLSFKIHFMIRFTIKNSSFISLGDTLHFN